ncbi:hypothetical protein I4U23_017058 [Adineta vaga]|nr:hypothetical protein I4U23_017058 [Adineta vaga]
MKRRLSVEGKQQSCCVTSLIIGNGNEAGNRQFGFAQFLQVSRTYFVIVTTYSTHVTGSFSLITAGPASISYEQLNMTVQSIYSSALMDSSPTYCRESVCSRSFYYYQAIKINILTSGSYTIASNSSMDTYGYLYNDMFNPSFPSQNLIAKSDDNAANSQFGFVQFLQSTETYIVVVTTYTVRIMGAFSLIVNGAASVTFKNE